MTTRQTSSLLRNMPAAGFEAPFDMLRACHERVNRMLGLLGRLRAHVREHGVDEQARQAARDVMRYFDIAAPEHHRDEELHVFPALLALGDESLTHVVARLERDHVLMDARWRAAREVLQRLAEPAPDARPVRGGLSGDEDETLSDFLAVYDGHIEAEESIAYPRAERLIEGERLRAMSSDMMARRGVRDLPR
jgi:hemerythrin-like domain-containing protein